MPEDRSKRFEAVVGVRPSSQPPSSLPAVERAELKDVLGTPSGRWVMWRVLARCGIYTRSLSETDSLTAFHEGRRSVGLELLIEIRNAEPEAYIKMQTENLVRELEAQEAARQKEKKK